MIFLKREVRVYLILFSENNRSVGSFLLLGGEFFFSKQDRETTGHEEREA